jgi:hypothetical protein
MCAHKRCTGATKEGSTSRLVFGGEPRNLAKILVFISFSFPKKEKVFAARGTNLYTVGAGLIACPQTRVGLFLKGPYEKKYWRPLLEVAGGPQSCFQKSLSRRGILWVRTLPSSL